MTDAERALLIALAEALCEPMPIGGYVQRIAPLLATTKRERENPPASR